MLAPLPELVRDLNAFRPAIVAGYPTAIALLADEQAERRLRIAPALISTLGECLTPPLRRQIETAFACRVHDSYGSSEVQRKGYRMATQAFEPLSTVHGPIRAQVARHPLITAVIYPTAGVVAVDALAAAGVAFVLSGVRSPRRGVRNLLRSLSLRQISVRWYWLALGLWEVRRIGAARERSVAMVNPTG